MRFAAFLAQALLILPPCVAGPAISVWPVDSLVKVFPDDEPGKNRASERAWLIARNGHTSVQFAVRSASPLENFDIRVALHAGLSAEIRRAGYVPVRAKPPKSPDDELARMSPGKFPDPLFEDLPFTLRANETTPVWITISAPTGTAPGHYKSEIEFRSGSKTVARTSFHIQVTPAIVPARQTLKVTNWFNLDETAMRQYYDLSAAPGRYWDLIANIARVIAEHRQNTILTPVLSLTDARLNEGSVAYDFSRLDRWVEIFTRAGAADVIEGGHLIDRAGGYDTPLRIPAFVVDNGTVRRDLLEASDPRVETHISSFLPALYAHLKEKGWLDRYVQHVLDEAHGSEPPVYLNLVKLVRKTLPGVPTIDAIDQHAGLLGDACDIWVPQLGRFDDAFDAIREHVRKGGQAWYYVCLFPQTRHMNRFIDYPLLKTRLLHWFNFRYDLTGYLHWGGNHWDADPFTNTEPALDNGAEVLPSGDAFITYPWREKNSIHSSIRFEAMREGIEDYELLRVLAAQQPDRARHIAEEAISTPTHYVRDPAAFRKLQAELYKAFR